MFTFSILIRQRKSGSSPPVVGRVCLRLPVVDFNKPVSVVSVYKGTTGAFSGLDRVWLLAVLVVGMELVSVVRSLG
jgi:hypothetical protein